MYMYMCIGTVTKLHVHVFELLCLVFNHMPDYYTCRDATYVSGMPLK